MGLLIKKRVIARERERAEIAEERKVFTEWQASCDPGKVICLDESSVKTNYTPMRGWSEKGKRCEGMAPGRWKTYTLLSYLKFDGQTDGVIFPGAVNTAIFREFMEKVLLPATHKGDVVIMDNLNVHKKSFDKKLFEKKGVEIRYTPRYSPEFNPIEMMWSKIKSDLRKAEPRDFFALWRESSCSQLDVTAENAHGWYKESGYCH